VLLMSFLAGIVTFLRFAREQNYLLAGINIVVLITTVYVILEAASAVAAFKSNRRGAIDSG